jgi:hypothetical protein
MINPSQKTKPPGGERRRSRRVVFQLRAESFSENRKYKGFIENFSLEGMLKIIPEETVIDFTPGMKLEVSLQLPAGDTFKLGCEIKWVRHRTNMPFGLKHYVGIEIINPPQVYREFVQDLYATYEEH